MLFTFILGVWGMFMCLARTEIALLSLLEILAKFIFLTFFHL